MNVNKARIARTQETRCREKGMVDALGLEPRTR